jgi:metal-responsive CopG/Arc/MetJ family transcriptional regulator
MSTNVIRKKKRAGGRKRIGKKPAAVFAMRLPEEVAARVDAYAAKEGIKSRSEAIRLMIEQALAAAPKRGRKD